ncbi:MAG: phospho-sugar mutase [Planctomycetes bacterium]|nr:phospho-sugar mutase [Planctomycetota bacterium]
MSDLPSTTESHQTAPALDPAVVQALASLKTAQGAGQIGEQTLSNLQRWLTEPGYARYVPQILALVQGAKFDELDSLFWEVIPFGTGGRRGVMTEFGSATMNERTVAESANGIAVYLAKVRGTAGGRAVIACDTRLRSDEFARLSAQVLAAHGLQVFLFESHRSTPELSFAVRHLKCDVGIMISASHNPPSDNGVKAYWSNGAQVLPPHDKGIIECVYESNLIPVDDYDQAVADGKIQLIGADVDEAFTRAVLRMSLSPTRELKALYTPLHGVGETSVFRVLQEAGFEGVEIFEPQRQADGKFPNVPNHLPNPELPAVFDPPIEQARASGAAVVLASDPDADRLGVAVRDHDGNYVHLTGNRIAVLLTDYVLRKRKGCGMLGPQHFVVETLVTTPLVGALARAAKIRAIDNLLVGFKYIAQTMDREGPDRFVFGCEESLGYLSGSYARDKDASIAALYLCECAAELQKQNKTLLDRLDELYRVHGYYLEGQRSEACKGPKGRALIERLLDALANDPPRELAGVQFARVRDYQRHEIRSLPDNLRVEDLPEPQGDLAIFESAPSDLTISFAARPSGTEPKIKFYFFARAACPEGADLEDIKHTTATRLNAFQDALSAWVHKIWES